MLLSHYYYRPDDEQQLIQAQIADWVEMLKGFPQDAISHAVQRYMRERPGHKPTPGDIANRASTWVGTHMPPPKAPDVEQPRRDILTAEQADAIMVEYGFSPRPHAEPRPVGESGFRSIDQTLREKSAGPR